MDLSSTYRSLVKKYFPNALITHLTGFTAYPAQTGNEM